VLLLRAAKLACVPMAIRFSIQVPPPGPSPCWACSVAWLLCMARQALRMRCSVTFWVCSYLESPITLGGRNLRAGAWEGQGGGVRAEPAGGRVGGRGRGAGEGEGRVWRPGWHMHGMAARSPNP